MGAIFTVLLASTSLLASRCVSVLFILFLFSIVMLLFLFTSSFTISAFSFLSLFVLLVFLYVVCLLVASNILSFWVSIPVVALTLFTSVLASYACKFSTFLSKSSFNFIVFQYRSCSIINSTNSIAWLGLSNCQLSMQYSKVVFAS